MKISEYDRRLEPRKFKEKEGETIKWGIKKCDFKGQDCKWNLSSRRFRKRTYDNNFWTQTSRNP